MFDADTWRYLIIADAFAKSGVSGCLPPILGDATGAPRQDMIGRSFLISACRFSPHARSAGGGSAMIYPPRFSLHEQQEVLPDAAAKDGRQRRVHSLRRRHGMGLFPLRSAYEPDIHIEAFRTSLPGPDSPAAQKHFVYITYTAGDTPYLFVTCRSPLARSRCLSARHGWSVHTLICRR